MVLLRLAARFFNRIPAGAGAKHPQKFRETGWEGVFQLTLNRWFTSIASRETTLTSVIMREISSMAADDCCVEAADSPASLDVFSTICATSEILAVISWVVAACS